MLSSLILVTTLFFAPQAGSMASAASPPLGEVDLGALVDEARDLMRKDPQRGTPQLEEVATMLQSRTKARPKDFEGWFLLGRASFYLNRDETAAHAFDEAITLDPKHADAKFFRGLVHMYSGEAKEALVNFQDAILLDPTKPQYTIEFSKLLTRAGRPEQALTALEVATETIPDNAPLHYQAGNLAYELGDYTKAKGYYRRASEIDPNDTNTLFNLGQVEKNLGNLEAAQDAFQRVVDLEPKYWHALAKVVQLAEMRGDTEARDESRKRLFDLRRAATIPSLVEAKSYYRDRFEVGDVIVVAEERFVREEPYFQQYVFFVLDANEKRKDYVLSYGSMEQTTEIAREQGEIGPDERMWHVDEYSFDTEGRMNGQTLVVMSRGEIPYASLKELVREHVAEREAESGSTSEPGSATSGSAASKPKD